MWHLFAIILDNVIYWGDWEVISPGPMHSRYSQISQDISPWTIMRAEQWNRAWNLAMKVRPTHGGFDRSQSTPRQLIFPPFFLLFHHFPQPLCGLMPDLACRSLEVTDYKLVLCQSALWWGEITVTPTHVHAHTPTNVHTHALRWLKGSLFKCLVSHSIISAGWNRMCSGHTYSFKASIQIAVKG